MRGICINGRYLTRQTTGVDRYAREILSELDGLAKSLDIRILVPEKDPLVDAPSLKNISIVRFGKHSGYVWEQIDLKKYTKRNQMLTVNLCNTAPIMNTGLVCIHDMQVRANPGYYSRLFVLVYRFLYWFEIRQADAIITVSEFSKREIEKYYPSAKGRIRVISNAWQHVNRVDPDSSILFRNNLVRGSYYFAMSSLAPNKNLRWIVETARLNPKEKFAIAGGINSSVFGKHGIPKADNIVYLGYVTDGEAKALMKSCKGFCFPTFYEGFGIPPMEALACGAPVAVSDTDVMHEIYDDSVIYIDPYTPCGDINALFERAEYKAADVLRKFSWRDSASKLLTTILEL